MRLKEKMETLSKEMETKSKQYEKIIAIKREELFHKSELCGNISNVNQKDNKASVL